MPAFDSLRVGKLQESLTQLQDEVRRHPADPKQRIFLFQLLSVMGQWDRAMTQLGVLSEMDDSALAMVQTYREVLQCESLRREVFEGRRTPVVIGEPAQWVALLIEALRLGGEGRATESQAMRSHAFELAPATSGAVDGQRFEWIADSDPRLGPVLELVVNGRYSWVPFSRIRRLALEEPSDLRDLVWLPAHVTWTNGGEAVAFVPVRYPGSEKSSDEAIALARKTEWADQGGDLYFGLGQRMLVSDAGEYPVLAIRQIELDAEPAPAEAPR
ncbi:MAG: virulence protein SciE type [Gammaproteobacteria bacterium]|jgi:type VI secretion system protein ImpE|nr:virulence protein SciE type [Gammaproteobacteria bacterium]